MRMFTTNRRGLICELAVASVLVASCAGAATTVAPTPMITASPPAMATPTAEPTPTAPPAAIIDTYDVAGAGWAMTLAAGALWIQVDPPTDAVVRVDLTTRAVEPAVPLGWKAKSGPEGIWVVCCDWLARVDPATGKEDLRIPLGGSFALGEGAVWLFNEDGLYRIDATTGDIGDPIGPAVSSVCASTKDLVIAFRSAWLACKEGKVVRIDIATGKATTIVTHPGSHTFAVTSDAVWVTNYQAGSVSRIDPATNQETSVAKAGSGIGITIGGGYVWAATATGIAKIDPTTRLIADVIELGPGDYYELVWDDGFIWASTRGPRILKVDPSRSGG
jgi:hypothetical protein